MNRPIGEIALDIRGTTIAISAYLNAKAFNLVVGQIIRGKHLTSELDYILLNKHLLGENCVLRDWLRIAREEAKDLQAMLEIASSQLPRFEIS